MPAENVRETAFHSRNVYNYPKGSVVRVAGVGWVRIEGTELGSTGTIPATILEGERQGTVDLITKGAYVDAEAGSFSDAVPTDEAQLREQVQSAEARTAEHEYWKQRNAAEKRQAAPTSMEEKSYEIEIKRTGPGTIAVTRPEGTSFFYGEEGLRSIGREFGYNIAETFTEKARSVPLPIRAGDTMLHYKPPSDVYGQMTNLKFTAEQHIAEREAEAVLLKGQPTFSEIQGRAERAGYPTAVATGIAATGIVAGYSIKGVSDLIQGTAQTVGRARRVFFTGPGEKQESPVEVVTDVVLAPFEIPYTFRTAARERGVLAAIAYTAPAAATTLYGAKGAVKGLGRLDTFISKRAAVSPVELTMTEGRAPIEIRPTKRLPPGWEPFLTEGGDIGLRRSGLIEAISESEASRVYRMKVVKGAGVDVIDIENIYPKNLKPRKADVLLPFERRALGEQIRFSAEEGFKHQLDQERILKNVQNLNILEEQWFRKKPALPGGEDFLAGAVEKSKQMYVEREILGRPGRVDLATGIQEFKNVKNLNFLEEPLTPTDLKRWQRATRRTKPTPLVRLPEFFDRPLIENVKVPRQKFTAFEKAIVSNIRYGKEGYNIAVPKFFDEMPKRRYAELPRGLGPKGNIYTAKDILKRPEGRGVTVKAGRQQLLLRVPQVEKEGRIIRVPKVKQITEVKEARVQIGATTSMFRNRQTRITIGNIATRQRPGTRIGQVTIPRSAQIPRQAIKIRQNVIQRPRITTITVPRITTRTRTRITTLQRTTTRAPPYTPTRIRPPKKPPLKMKTEYPFVRRVRKGKSRRSMLPKNYQPSLAGIAEGLKIGKTPSVVMGFERRGILSPGRRKKRR